MKYVVDDKKLNAATFIAFVNQVWQGSYDVEKTQGALSKTINITAYDNEVLIGCLRILTDGYYFGTITELLVLPEYQKQDYKRHGNDNYRRHHSGYVLPTKSVFSYFLNSV